LPVRFVPRLRGVLVLYLSYHPTAAFRACPPRSHANTHWTKQEDQDAVLTLLIVSVFATGGTTALGLSLFFMERIVKAVSPAMLLCFRAGTAGAMISLAVSLIKRAAPLLPLLFIRLPLLSFKYLTTLYPVRLHTSCLNRRTSSKERLSFH
jgi:hypothetical protein